MNDRKLPDEVSAVPAPGYGLPPFDPSVYNHHIQDFDLTDEQRAELLGTLWWIMAAFVDLGFGVDSVRYFLPDLAKLSSEFRENALDIEDTDHTPEFNEAAKDEPMKDDDHDG